MGWHLKLISNQLLTLWIAHLNPPSPPVSPRQLRTEHSKHLGRTQRPSSPQSPCALLQETHTLPFSPLDGSLHVFILSFSIISAPQLLRRLVAHMVIYNIWQERNFRLQSGISSSSEEILKFITEKHRIYHFNINHLKCLIEFIPQMEKEKEEK